MNLDLRVAIDLSVDEISYLLWLLEGKNEPEIKQRLNVGLSRLEDLSNRADLEKRTRPAALSAGGENHDKRNRSDRHQHP